jgi:hypothetical protein
VPTGHGGCRTLTADRPGRAQWLMDESNRQGYLAATTFLKLRGLALYQRPTSRRSSSTDPDGS